MLIEVNAPASLPLGLVKVRGEVGVQTCLMGVTLKYPPVQLSAQDSAGCIVTGARAELAYRFAERFSSHHGLSPRGQVEIELAIPRSMGLGSDAMLGLSVACALAWIHGLPTDDTWALAQAIGLGPEHALEIWGFDQGGFLIVEAEEGSPRIVWRRELAHPNKAAWAFVFLLPRTTPDTPESLEADRLAQLLRAAPHLGEETGHWAAEVLWPAMESDDLPAFARALMAIDELNRQALAAAGTPVMPGAEAQALLEFFRNQGALAWGQSLTGMTPFALVRGEAAAAQLKEKLLKRVGHYAGSVMAAIADNRGAHHRIKDERLTDYRLGPVRPRTQ